MKDDLKTYLIDKSHDPECVMDHSERAAYALLVMPEWLQRKAGKEVLGAILSSVVSAMEAVTEQCGKPSEKK